MKHLDATTKTMGSVGTAACWQGLVRERTTYRSQGAMDLLAAIPANFHVSPIHRLPEDDASH
ncbi:MAG: hypothetical protein JJU45_11790 [Acidimicrobiia bacterium]|nr:hypothetical protein [Acidimicrobiia bacterium]